MAELRPETIQLIEYLQSAINPEVEDDFLNQWRDFTYDRLDCQIFTPKRSKLAQPKLDLPQININDAVEDYDLMLRSQLTGVARALSTEGGGLTIRANYGTGITSSLHGAEIYTMPYHTNTLPTTKPMGGEEKMQELLGKGVPNLRGGLGEKVFDFAEFYKNAIRGYDVVEKYVTVYHPDLQGPLDTCELLMGGEMFYVMMDSPELVCSLLDLITDTYVAFMEKWQSYFPPRQDMNAHFGYWYKGQLLLRCDSAMNISPDMYKAFSVPYDQRLLDRFSGGAVHFCGRGDHYIAELSKMKGVYAINMTQPEYNDMEIIYRNTVDKGIKILDFDRQRAQLDKSRAGSFSSNMHVI